MNWELLGGPSIEAVSARSTRPNQSTPFYSSWIQRRVRRAPALLGSVLMLVVLAGCDSPDSIDDVRNMQSLGKFEASLEPLRVLLEESPDDPELNYRYGTALRVTGAPDRAIWALRKAAESEQWARAASLELGASAIADRHGAAHARQAIYSTGDPYGRRK